MSRRVLGRQYEALLAYTVAKIQTLEAMARVEAYRLLGAKQGADPVRLAIEG